MAAKVVGLVIPLGLDTFAVAAALGMLGAAPGARLRISILFPAFEAAMPLVGLALGGPLGRAIGDSADYVAIGVLLAFGLYTLVGSEAREERAIARFAEARGTGALLLGLSIILDELAVGFTLGLLRLPAALVIALIALQALVLTQLGLRVGGRLSERLRESAERLAGLALTALTSVLLADKLLSSPRCGFEQRPLFRGPSVGVESQNSVDGRGDGDGHRLTLRQEPQQIPTAAA